jgi:hypothetical protein
MNAPDRRSHEAKACGRDRFVAAQSRIRAAFALADPVDPPVMVWPFHYIACGCDPERLPPDLFESPAAMTEFQTRFCEEHLAAVDDDFQPYLTPYLGTGILASGFGCHMHFAPGRDPSVAAPCITSVADAARLKMPDPERDGAMPRVLELAAYMRAHGPYPVSLTDSQSPLDELALMCGHERLYLWMYDEPALVHDLFALTTEAFIGWVKAQKQVTGEALDVCHGEQGVWVPPPCGVWIADDEAVNLPPDLYAEFVAPYYPKIFEEFGGGVLHFCGCGTHLAPILRTMEGLRAINTGPVGRPEHFAALQQALSGAVPLIYQEMSPRDCDRYFGELLRRIALRGVIFAPQVCDRFATGGNGGLVDVVQDRRTAAKGILDALRRGIAAKRAGGASCVASSGQRPVAEPGHRGHERPPFQDT